VTAEQNARVLRRRDQRPSWSLPKANVVGYIRGNCDRMTGAAFSAGVALVPVGQRAPRHRNTGEHIMYMLEGVVEFEVDEDTFVLEAGDMLFIPAHATYAYANIDRTLAVFLSIIGKADQWPVSTTYDD
jgi:quercetin dioxygenase-like cupin family protein